MKLKTENGYVIGYEEDGSSEIIIPEGIIGIGAKAFYGCQLLNEIDIPNTIKYIRESAFAQSTLRSIKIPDSVELISDRAFGNCPNLKTAELSEQLKIIPKELFFYCKKLEQVRLPSHLEKIEPSAFEGCSSLQFIEISDTVKSISADAFGGCLDLTIKIPDNFCGEIEPDAFYACKEIQFEPFHIFRQLRVGDKLKSYYSVIRKYFQDNNYYTKNELEEFREFLKDNKDLIFLLDINNFEVLTFMFEEIESVYTIKETRELAVKYSNSHPGVSTYLLTYVHNKLESMGLTEADYTQNEFDLPDYTPEELKKLKNNDNEDEKKQSL